MSASQSQSQEIPKTRIVVVDDSALFRLVMRDVLNSIPGCVVVGTATNGRTAVDTIADKLPDVVTLDVEMPEMDGIETLREVNRRNLTTKILMVSRLTDSGAQATTDALLEGAFDFILKPSGNQLAENKARLREELQKKISAVRQSTVSAEPVADKEHVSSEPTMASEFRSGGASAIKLVIIGTSTGGPDALKRVIPKLARDLPVPVVVVQHMPSGFTTTLASRLNAASSIQVVEASDGDVLQCGTVSVVPGGQQMALKRRPGGRVVVCLTDDPPEHGCKPSINYTLRSAVEAYDGQLLTVIMTGMGHDGTEGCRMLRSRGGQVIAQHAAGCVIYGMPGSVIEAGLAHQVVKLEFIAPVINRQVKSAAH